MSDLPERKFDWIQAIAADAQLSPFARLVGIWISTKYLNNGSQTAWPSIETLAADLKVDRRTVQRALVELVTAGWIDCERKGGRGHANLYRLKGGKTAAYSTDKGRQFRRERAAKMPPEPFEEPVDKNCVRTAREKNGSETRKQEAVNNPTRRKANTPRSQRADYDTTQEQRRLPVEEWLQKPEHVEIAATIVGWDAERATREWEDKFKPWYDAEPHRARNVRTEADLLMRWESWCKQGIGIDARGSNKGYSSTRQRKCEGTADTLKDIFEENLKTAQRRGVC